MLCFHSNDRDQLRVPLLYWSVSQDAKKWENTAQSLADGLGVRVDQLPGVLSTIADAYDLQIRCADCGTPRLLTTRSAFQHELGYNFICPECASARRREQQELLQAKLSEGNARALRIIQDQCASNEPFSYSTITYFDATLAYAIMLTSETACATGKIGDITELPLCPSDKPLLDITRRLHRSGIIQFSDDTPLEAIAPPQESDKEGVFRYYPLEIDWQLAEDIDGRSFPAVFRDLGETINTQDLNTDYEEAISNLWWMLAVDEINRYLNEQVDSYCLPAPTVGDKTLESIRYALGIYSIPQVRNLVWSVVKNAAALSKKREYSSKHALNTIPGNLIRYCDRARAENWEVRPYLRNWSEDEAVLITLLFDRVLGTGVAGFSTSTGARFCLETPWK